MLLRYLDTLVRVLQAVERDCGDRLQAVLACRLASDMMPFAAQVETAAYLALRTALPLAGRGVPPFSRSDATVAGLMNTVQQAAEIIRRLEPEEFSGADDRVITEVAGEATLQLPAWTFLGEFALPNFMFHVSMAYAIARSQGCRLGKAQFDGYHVYRAA